MIKFKLHGKEIHLSISKIIIKVDYFYQGFFYSGKCTYFIQLVYRHSTQIIRDK